jgi:hypothetical protein
MADPLIHLWGEHMKNSFTKLRFSRRTLLAGMAAVPALTAPFASTEAQMPAAIRAAEQVKAALKEAKGTKLVILGMLGLSQVAHDA